MSKRRTFSDLVDVNVRNFSVEYDEPIDSYGELVDQFLADRAAKNLSSHSVKYYRTKLWLWHDRLQALGLSTDVRNLSEDTIKRYLADHTQVRGLKYSSALIVLRAVKAFANWLQSSGVIESHGFQTFTLGQATPSPPETFSEGDILRLLSQPDIKRFTGLRDYVIMLTFLETGIRLRELADLSVLDVDFDDRVLKVFGKNQSFRYVPFQPIFGKVLRQYLKVRGNSPTKALFISQDDESLSSRRIQELLRDYGKQANITNVRVSPHTFRHTFAKMYIQNGGDPFSLQTILGHSTMDMVRRYVNMYGKEIDEAHRKFSPLSRILR